tara:strand:- start:40 stop:273 length:234 start_codon:yes stop_codon:yes gene_type:complete
MVLVVVVDSLELVKVVVMVVVTEVLVLIFPSQVHLLDMVEEVAVVLLFQDQPLIMEPQLMVAELEELEILEALLPLQ